MRVLLISREFFPFVGGGIGSYTERMARALAGAGHKAVVLTVSRSGREERERLNESPPPGPLPPGGGVEVVRLPFIRGDDWSRPDPTIDTPEVRAVFSAFHPVAAFAMQAAAALPGLVREFGIDIVEVPECGALGWFLLNEMRLGKCGQPLPPPSAARTPPPPGAGEGAPSRTLVSRLASPVVVHVHSPTEWIEHWNRAPAFDRASVELKAMEADCLAWADGLVCPSAQVGGWVEERWGLERGAIEASPLPMGELEARARAVAGGGAGREGPGWESGGARRVLFAGRMEPRKGTDVLLGAFRIVVERGADLKLDIAGRDTDDPETGRPFGATRVEGLPASVQERVALRGELGPEALGALRMGAHIAVVPSPSETGPYTLIEAMASGMVCVASRAGGMSEMIRDGVDGILFEPGDARACAEALARAAAMSGAEARRMGAAAAARIVERSGAEAVVRRRVDHYARTIARRGTRAAESLRSDDSPVVVVSGEGEAGSETGARLAESLARAAGAGVGFLHGWTRLPGGRVLAFGTPRLETLAIAPRDLGPVAVRERWLGAPLVRGMVDVRRTGGPSGVGFATVGSTWELCVALAATGAEGAVDPTIVSPVRGVGTVRDVWKDLPPEMLRRVEERIGRAPGVAAGAGVAGGGGASPWRVARRVLGAIRRRVLRAGSGE